jgi:hypothetical protein
MYFRVLLDMSYEVMLDKDIELTGLTINRKKTTIFKTKNHLLNPDFFLKKSKVCLKGHSHEIDF